MSLHLIAESDGNNCDDDDNRTPHQTSGDWYNYFKIISAKIILMLFRALLAATGKEAISDIENGGEDCKMDMSPECQDPLLALFGPPYPFVSAWFVSLFILLI